MGRYTPMIPTRDLACYCIHSEIGHPVSLVYEKPINLCLDDIGNTIETWVFRPYQHDYFRYQVDVLVDEVNREYRVIGLYTQAQIDHVHPVDGPTFKWEYNCRVKVFIDTRSYRLPFKGR